MKTIIQKLRLAVRNDSTLRDDRGLSTVEYVIILVVVAVLAIGVWQKLGSAVKDQVSGSTDDINNLRNEQPVDEGK